MAVHASAVASPPPTSTPVKTWRRDHRPTRGSRGSARCGRRMPATGGRLKKATARTPQNQKNLRGTANPMHSARLWFLVFPELDPMRGGSFGFFMRRMPLRFSIYGLQTRPAVCGSLRDFGKSGRLCRASLEALLRLTTRGRERIRSPGGAIFLPVVEAGKRNFKGTFTARVSALLSTIR